MRRIGVLYNPLSETSRTISEELTTWLQSREVDVWRGFSQEARDNPSVFKGMELLITMGGDGTVLRAARPAILYDIPIFPVALGHLSFMAEIGPEDMYHCMETLLEHGCWYDQRTLIDIVLLRRGQPLERSTVLNEAVVSRGDVSRIVTVDVQIDDIPLTTYRADGVLVSTATGSTAYALSAGGPIVDPRSRTMILVPVAAHLTAVPSMVLHEDTRIILRLRSRHHAILAVDGHDNIPLEQDDEVIIQRSSQVCKFARVQPPGQFYARLMRRLRRE
ncbi:MAG: NAD(+)/NADH kinase [Chloroflexaceae bacterium]